MVSYHDGIPVTGYAFYSHDMLRRMHLADAELEASLATSLALLAGINYTATPQLLPQRVDLEKPASWVCPPMGGAQEVLLSNAGPGGARMVELPSCVDDVRVQIRGKDVPVQVIHPCIRDRER